MSEKQAEHLKKAREIRNENQADIMGRRLIDNRLSVLEEIGTVFHSEGFSYKRYSEQIAQLRQSWPELLDKLDGAFGKTPY